MDADDELGELPAELPPTPDEEAVERELDAERRALHLREFRRAFHMPEPDDSPIYDWAARNVVLPDSYATPGPFHVELSPWLIPIFAALQDPLVRKVHFRKAVQMGGTLVADIWVPWIIKNDPGPISWTMQVDDMMEKHCKSRLMPLLERIKCIAVLLPRLGPHRTTTEIFFNAGFFLTCNAANISSQQSQSIRYKINDEIWMPKWQEVYGQAVARVTKYEEVGRSKILNISQAPIMDAETGNVEDTSFRSGHMAEWSAVCPSCNKAHPLQFSQSMTDDPKKHAGVVWDHEAKRDDETLDVVRAAASVRFRCPHCGHESPDTDETREAWRKSGHYVATRTDAPREIVSFHLESLPTRPMRLLVEEWCEAENHAARQGDNTARIDFRTKREAKPWIVESRTINLFTKSSGYKLSEFANGERIANEVGRFMLIDKQQDHWWVLIIACSTDSGSLLRMLHFGRVETRDMLRVLQTKYLVHDQCVAQDRGFRPADVDRDCAEFGWRALRGYGRKSWTMKDEVANCMVNFPYSDPKIAQFQGADVFYYEFSGDYFKDVLATALEGKGDVRFQMPDDCNPLFLEHLKGEAKVEIRSGVWEWREVKSNAPNHGLDLAAMALCVTTIAGIVRFVPPPQATL